MMADEKGLMGNAHPVLLIGIGLFVLPIMKNLPGLGWIPSWFGTLGIVGILVGAGLSIYKSSK